MTIASFFISNIFIYVFFSIPDKGLEEVSQRGESYDFWLLPYAFGGVLKEFLLGKSLIIA